MRNLEAFLSLSEKERVDVVKQACRKGDDVPSPFLDHVDLAAPDECGVYLVEHAFCFMTTPDAPLRDFERRLLRQLPPDPVALHTLAARAPEEIERLEGRLDFERRIFEMSMVGWAAHARDAAAIRTLQKRLDFDDVRVLIESPLSCERACVEMVLDALPDRHDPRYAVMARHAFMQLRPRSDVIDGILSRIVRFPDLVTYAVMPCVAFVVRADVMWDHHGHRSALKRMIGALIESVRPTHAFEGPLDACEDGENGENVMNPVGLPERLEMDDSYERMLVGRRPFEWRGLEMQFREQEMTIRPPAAVLPRCGVCGLSLDEHARAHQPHLLVETWGEFVPSYGLRAESLQTVFTDPLAFDMFPELNDAWRPQLVKSRCGEGGGGGGGGGENAS